MKTRKVKMLSTRCLLDFLTKNPELLSYNFICLKTQLMYFGERSSVNFHCLNSAMTSSGRLNSFLHSSR